MSSAATKRRATSRRGMAGSSVSDLIMQAASAADASAGVSLAFLKKALKAAGYDVGANRDRLIPALKRLVANKYLVQVKGTRSKASGSFKVSKSGRKNVAQKKKADMQRVERSRARKAATATAAAKKKRAKRNGTF